jgi:excisionase family DNA binding protein
MNTKSTPAIQLFTSAKVAEVLKMNAQVVARKLQSGELEGYKIGKDWRVSQEQLLRFLDKHSNQRAPKSAEEKTLEVFFTDGKLKQIPTTRSKRVHVLRHLVQKLEPNRIYTEKEINEFITQFHSDVCTIRREFIMNKLMVRNAGKYKVSTWNLQAKPQR